MVWRFQRTVFSAVAELGDPKVRARVGGFLKAGNRSRRIASVALVLLESYGASMTAPLLAAEARLLEWGFLRDEDAGSTPISAKIRRALLTLGLSLLSAERKRTGYGCCG